MTPLPADCGNLPRIAASCRNLLRIAAETKVQQKCNKKQQKKRALRLPVLQSDRKRDRKR